MATAKKAAAKAAPATSGDPDVAPQAAQVETANGSTGNSAAARAAARTSKKAATAADAAHASGGGLIKGTKDGVAFTKDFDLKFLTAQRTLLLEEKQSLLGQAIRLEDEANSLIEESEMGDVQFDDEGGEGDTMVVERERDLALSAQARQTIADIDAALQRIADGTYGYSVESGRPIPRERLEAIPWATVLVEEKVGGIGRR
jgi:RNA polymerase-binding transcription factor DksA